MDNLRKGILVRNGVCVGAVGDKNISTLHVGCITPYLGTKDNIPRGYLLADGASYKTTDYPELFNIIGYTYGGSGDTFNVPNLSDGRFLEGSDTSGEYVEAGLPNITGELVSLNAGTSNFKDTEFINGAFSATSKWNTVSGSGNMDSYGEVSFDASKSNAIYSDDVDTVQPKSLRVLYIIKAFHTNEGVDSNNEVSDPIIEYVEGEIASELKTSSNVDKTLIEFDTDYASHASSNSNFYTVRNGICYVYMDFTMAVDNPSGKGILANALPKPIGAINCQVTVYNNSTIPQGVFILDENGSFIADMNLKSGERYLYNFSYPIA